MMQFPQTTKDKYTNRSDTEIHHAFEQLNADQRAHYDTSFPAVDTFEYGNA